MSVSIQQIAGQPYNVTTVEIPSARLKTLGSNPMNLLAAAGVSSYYEGYIEFQYDFGTTPYTITDPLSVIAIYSGGGFQADNISALVNSQFLTFLNADGFLRVDLGSFAVAVSTLGVSAVLPVGAECINKTLNITVRDSTGIAIDFANGDGNMTLKIYQRIRTIGA